MLQATVVLLLQMTVLLLPTVVVLQTTVVLLETIVLLHMQCHAPHTYASSTARSLYACPATAHSSVCNAAHSLSPSPTCALPAHALGSPLGQPRSPEHSRNMPPSSSNQPLSHACSIVYEQT